MSLDSHLSVLVICTLRSSKFLKASNFGYVMPFLCSNLVSSSCSSYNCPILIFDWCGYSLQSLRFIAYIRNDIITVLK